MATRYGPEFRRNRKELLQDKPNCHWCRKRPATEADHLVEADAGGTDELSNLVPSCKECNSKRGAIYGNRKRTIQKQKREQLGIYRTSPLRAITWIDCQHCGLSFQPDQKGFDRGTVKYCSRKCFSEAQRTRTAYEHHLQWNCPACGNKLQHTINKTYKPTAEPPELHCNKECSRIALAIRMRDKYRAETPTVKQRSTKYGDLHQTNMQITTTILYQPTQTPAEQFISMQTETSPTASFSLSGKVQDETDEPARIVTALPGVGRIEPRLVSVVGVSDSYGPEVADWSEKFLGKTLMGWQRVALDGQLTHDESGELLHREALISCARQQGKSVALTALIGWALTRWPVHRGEPVHVLSVANKLDRAVAIFLELCDILEAHGAKVTRAYGRNKVVMPDGSTWEVRAAVPGLHGMSPTLIVVDELWNISEDVFFDALRPSQIAQRSPLMSCWSTAGDEGSKAMLRLREQALAAIDAGKATKLFFAEWSMPPGAQPMDPANWGWANPALGTTVTLEALRAAAETPDRGAFLRAHCNLWVSAADAWLPPGLWEKRDGGACDDPGGVLVIESAVDESKFIGVRCRALEGRTHVQIEFVADSSFQMWAEIDRLMVDPKLTLAIAAGLEIHTPERLRFRRTIWGYAEVLKWTGLVRSMVLEGRIVHDGGSMLAEHVNRAVLTRAQGSVVLSSQRSPGPIEAARAMVVGAALVSAPAQRGKAVMGFAR